MVTARAALAAVLFLGCAPVARRAGTVREGEPRWLRADGGLVAWAGELKVPAQLGIEPHPFVRFLKAVFGDDEPTDIYRPASVAVSTDGRIAVADPGRRNVRVYAPAQNETHTVDAPLRFPVAVAFYGPLLFVADAETGRLSVFDREGRPARMPARAPPFIRPVGLACDALRSRLYVADAGAHEVVALDLLGGRPQVLGRRGSQAGEFNFPTNVAVDGAGRVYVTDALNFRVQVFDADLKFERAFGELGDRPGQFSKAKGLAVDAHGTVWVVEGFFDVVQAFDADGRLVSIVGGSGVAPGLQRTGAGLLAVRRGPMMAVLLAGAVIAASPPDVRSTRHNLSASSTNAVRATSEDQVCVFCHTPHSAAQSKAVWNRDLGYQQSGTLYAIYGSSTLDAVPNRPNGSSKLCLSCHDGSLALGSLLNLDAVRPANVAMQGGVTTMPAGPRNLGTDLRNDHPVSLTLSPTDSELTPPPPSDPVRLREGATAGVKDSVQCTSCHDPHVPDPRFLVKPNTRGGLCLTCHTKQGWVGSRHEASNAPYPATSTTTVGERACLACHSPHNAQSPTRLLSTQNLSGAPLPWAEENVCFSCHRAGGTGVDPLRGRAAPDIQSEFQKAVRHPFALKLDEHQPVFTNKVPEPEPVLNPTKHVECADCHNPHRVQALPGNVHEGMKGVSLSGAVVVDDAVTDLKQYEVCFRCHGDTFASFIPPAPTRPPSGSNKRLEFQPTNDSYHPVAAPGRNTSTYLNNVLDAPDGQLMGNDSTGARLNRFSQLLCTDCHNSDATGTTQGSARGSTASPKGPHGSANTRMLRANYSTQVGVNNPPFGGYNRNNFALCFLCHDENRLRGSGGPSRSNFFQAGGVGAGRGNLHEVHLVDRTNASCHECHYNVHSNQAASNTDTRGVPPGFDSHLVNFAPTVRPFPASRGADPWYGDNPTKPRWGRTPAGDPYCFAGCHDKDDAMDGSDSRYRPPNP